MAKVLEKKHSLATRWLHWISFPLLTLMIWSGILIYWANPIFSVKIFGYELFHFFPAGFYEIAKVDFWGFKIPDYLPEWAYSWTSIPQRLAEGLSLHFFFMWFFLVNGMIYVAYLIFSGEWRGMLPVPGSFKRAALVTLHDLHIVKKLPPQGKYNDAQRIAYTGVIFLGAAAVVTGLAIYKPLQLSWLTSLLGGYEWARWEHFWIMLSFIAFFVVHVVQVILAGWGNFRSMISGYETVKGDGLPASVSTAKEAQV